MIKIKQKHYGNLEIDTSEKDVIQIFMETNLIDEAVQIERENLPRLIEILQGELKKI